MKKSFLLNSILTVILTVVTCNILPGQTNTGTELYGQQEKPLNFSISPNPVSGNQFQIQFKFPINEPYLHSVSVVFTNLIGQTVFTYIPNADELTTGRIMFYPEQMKLDKGVYFVKLTIGDQFKVHKMVLR
jgi:hypothetical protein